LSLEVTLQNAISGLQTSKTSIQTISNNIANVNTEGYSRKIIEQTSRVIDGRGFGVEIATITRNVDDGILRQLRTESGNLQELDTKQLFLSQINQFFGRPEDNNSITHFMSELGAQFDALALTPETEATQFLTVKAAVDTAEELDRMSDEIQRLRAEVNNKITTAVSEFNSAMTTVVDTNFAIIEFAASNISTAELADQRDQALNIMSEIMDIKYFKKSDSSLTVFTGSGQTLIDGQKQDLIFNQPSTMTAMLEYTPTSATNYLGPTETGFPVGGVEGIFVGEKATSADITSDINTGRLKALIDIRDTELPALQAQLDELSEKLKDELNKVHNSGTGYPPPSSLTGDRYIQSDTALDASGIFRVGIVNDSGTLQEGNVFNLSDAETFAAYESDLFSSATSDVITTAGSLTFTIGGTTAAVAYTASDTLTTLATKITANGTLSGLNISASVVTEGSNSRLRIADSDGDVFSISADSGSFLTDLNPKVRTMSDLVTGLSTMTNMTASVTSTGNLRLAADNNFNVTVNELTSSLSGPGDLSKGFSTFFGLNNFLDSNESFSTYRSDRFTSSSADVIGTAGTLHFSGNDGAAWTASVAYTASDTLTSLVTKINANTTLDTENVEAEVIADGDGFRLEITDTEGDDFAMVETGGGSILTDTGLRTDYRGMSGRLEVHEDIVNNTFFVSRGSLQSNTFNSSNYNSDTSTFAALGITAGTLTFTIDSSTTASVSYTTANTLTSLVTALNANSTLASNNIVAEVVIDGSNFKIKLVDEDGDNYHVEDSGSLGMTTSQGVTIGDGSVAEAMAAKFNATISFLAAPANGGGLAAADTTFSDYSASILSFNAAQVLSVERDLGFQEKLHQELFNKNGAISGVNMDEELSSMIVYEQAYLAAARIVTTTQELFRVLTDMV
jgi:flagellar hook-associated protein 1 FlgK